MAGESIMSHTVTVDIKMKNQDAVMKAAQGMGARIIGEGTHQLFDSSRTGLAFQLPKWSYPMVVDKDGNVFYDNYNGAWGSQDDVTKLKDTYAVMAVQSECEKLGWYTEVNPATQELVIHHPAGGTITVQKGGTLDAMGFSGSSCAEATLKIEQAMGNRLGETVKPEMNDVQLNQQVIGE